MIAITKELVSTILAATFVCLTSILALLIPLPNASAIALTTCAEVNQTVCNYGALTNAVIDHIVQRHCIGNQNEAEAGRQKFCTQENTSQFNIEDYCPIKFSHEQYRQRFVTLCQIMTNQPGCKVVQSIGDNNLQVEAKIDIFPDLPQFTGYASPICNTTKSMRIVIDPNAKTIKTMYPIP